MFISFEPRSQSRHCGTVAQKDAEDALNLWCHLWTEKVDQLHSRLLVILLHYV